MCLLMSVLNAFIVEKYGHAPILVFIYTTKGKEVTRYKFEK